MIETWEPIDEHDSRFAMGATGVLAEFNRAGVLTAADVHVATRLGVLVGPCEETGEGEAVLLAVAMAVRAARLGSVCVDLAAVMAVAPELPWPVPVAADWLALCQESVLAEKVLRFEGALVYLDRYHREEGQVGADLRARLTGSAPDVDEAWLAAEVERIFPGPSYGEQRAAATAAARQWTTVITGGPGTGKTTTVRGVLELLEAQAGHPLRIALTAPTGKAAARLQESVGRADLTASTLHRLLGWRPGSSTRFRHTRANTLPHDVIVVDETSMVSLTMMARLIEAVRPTSRLLLVGDADQLASVEAGAVLADLVAGLDGLAPGSVAHLRTSHRFGAEIEQLASALREGDPDAALTVLTGGAADGQARLVDPSDASAMAGVEAEFVVQAVALQTAATSGGDVLALADEHRLLCAHRDGLAGASYWNRRIQAALAEHLGLVRMPEWYAGRPVLITSNDHGLGLFNGDTGVTIDDGDRLRVLISGPQGLSFAPSRLPEAETLHAMTVHKSQGSQARRVTVLLPPLDSPLLTRELFYTAVTRAQEHVTVIGTPEQVRAAVTTRAHRATGLAARLTL